MLHVVIRSLLTMSIGVLLIIYRDAVMPFIVQCLGVAFMIPSLFALIVSIFGNSRQHGAKSWITIVTSLGSMAFGLWLLLSPTFFIAIIMNLLGVLVVIIGLYQFFILFSSRNSIGNIPVYLYLMPFVLVVLGLFVIANPFGAIAIPFLLLGIGAVLGGLSDIINTLFISRHCNNTTIEIE